MNEEIECLPTNFVGTSRPSKKIEALYERKEKAEKKSLQELEATKKEICERYEQLIESDTKELKDELEKMRELMKEKLFHIKVNSNQDNGNSMDKRLFMSAYRYIQNNAMKQVELVESFYQNLIEHEKHKAKEITSALSKTYEEIKRVSFRLPYQCDEVIEFEIEKVNQMIINNNHNYVQLKAKLQGEIQQHNKQCVQELQNVKDNWLKFVRVQAIKSLGNLKKQYSPYIADAIKTLNEEVNKIGNDLIKVDSVNQIPDPNEWLDGVRQTLARVDTGAQKIMWSYKQAAVLVHNKIFQDLSSIEDTLEKMDDQDLKEHAQMYTPDLVDIVDMYHAELETIQKMWNDWVDELTKATENTYKFLKAASTLWRNHFKRTETLQVAMLKDLENTMISHHHFSEFNELKLNVLIDTLRQSSSRDKLKKTLDDIISLLASMAEQYKSHYLEEVGVMKKYKNMQEFRADILLVEIKRFLEVYPPDMGKDPKIQRARASQTSIISDPSDDLIPLQMLFLKYQTGAIGNWQYGLWEYIRNYTAAVKTDVLEEIDKWIQSHIVTLDKRLEIRLCIHAFRLERIQAYIHDVRLEELREHQNRLEEHKNAIARRLLVLQKEHLNCQDVFEQLVKLIKSEIFQVSMDIVNTNNSYEAASRKPMLTTKFDEQIAKIKKESDDYSKKCNHFLNYVRACHVIFLENIKLFYEEGNFCSQEVQDIFKNIGKLEGQVEKGIAESANKVEIYKENALQEVNPHLEVLCGNNGTFDLVIGEHRFKEAIDKRIKDLQRGLIIEACKFESRERQVADNIDIFRKEMRKNCGDYKYFQTFYDQLSETVKQLIELGEFLLEDEPIKFYSNKPLSEDQNQVKYMETQLFNYPADKEDQETLWIRFNDILLNSWNKMKEFGNSFYVVKERCFCLDASKIPHSLQLLVKNFMYCRFHRLQNQCETKVMQLTKDYIHFAQNFLAFIEEFIDMFPNEYGRKALKSFQDFFQIEVREELQGYKNHLIEEYGKLQKRLKPLYGHPKNIRLLEDLEIEAEILRSETKELFTDIKIPYLKKMADEYNKAFNNYMDIKCLIPQCSQVLDSLKNLIEHLSLKLNLKVQLARQMVNSEYNVRDVEEIKPVIDHTKKILESFASQEIQQECEIEIPSSKQGDNNLTANNTRWSSQSLISSKSLEESVNS